MSDAQIAAEVLFLKCESIILRQSSNPVSVCGFSMMEQVRLCAVWPRELALHFQEPHAGLGGLSENATLVLQK